jgi:hypothetical protein
MTKIYSSFLLIFLCSGLFAQPIVRATVKNASCNGKADGSITLEVSGNAPFSYKWNDKSILQNRVHLQAGEYGVEVKDAMQIVTRVKVEVVTTANVSLVIRLIFNGIQAEARGGELPYTYTLTQLNNPSSSRSQAEPVFNNLLPGTYALVIKDNRGCMAIESIEIK